MLDAHGAGWLDGSSCTDEGLLSPPYVKAWGKPPPFWAQLLVHTFDEENMDMGHTWRATLNVPYVGPIHEEVDVVSHERRHLMSYVGSLFGTPETAFLRTRVRAACVAAGGPSACVAAKPQPTSAGNLAIRYQSTFCLEPNGFGMVRRSMVDAIAMGPSRFCRGLFSIGRPAFHSYGPDFHSRVLLCTFTTG